MTSLYFDTKQVKKQDGRHEEAGETAVLSCQGFKSHPTALSLSLSPLQCNVRSRDSSHDVEY